MAPHEPEEWPRTFTQHRNAGDVDAVVALYAPEARFVSPFGDVLVRRDRIRRVLAELIRARTQLRSRVVEAIEAGDPKARG